MFELGSEIGVRSLFKMHVGVYVGSGRVLHNHFNRGVEIISMDEFSGNKEIILIESGMDNVLMLQPRINFVLSQLNKYSAITNNCEHVARFIRSGVQKSPQLNGFSCLALFLGVAFLGRKTLR